MYITYIQEFVIYRKKEKKKTWIWREFSCHSVCIKMSKAEKPQPQNPTSNFQPNQPHFSFLRLAMLFGLLSLTTFSTEFSTE